jgi:dTDP-4-dehydrorhamnose reductase
MTAAGETSWCGFAREIMRLARIDTPIVPITTAEYPTPARRPVNSVMSNRLLRDRFGLALPPWSASLASCLATHAG